MASLNMYGPYILSKEEIDKSIATVKSGNYAYGYTRKSDNTFIQKPTRPSLPLKKAPHLSPILSLARRERM